MILKEQIRRQILSELLNFDSFLGDLYSQVVELDPRAIIIDDNNEKVISIGDNIIIQVTTEFGSNKEPKYVIYEYDKNTPEAVKNKFLSTTEVLEFIKNNYKKLTPKEIMESITKYNPDSLFYNQKTNQYVRLDREDSTDSWNYWQIKPYSSNGHIYFDYVGTYHLHNRQEVESNPDWKYIGINFNKWNLDTKSLKENKNMENKNIKESIDKQKIKKVVSLLKNSKVNPDLLSPNYVADFAYNRKIKLTSKEVVYISDNYENITEDKKFNLFEVYEELRASGKIPEDVDKTNSKTWNQITINKLFEDDPKLKKVTIILNSSEPKEYKEVPLTREDLKYCEARFIDFPKFKYIYQRIKYADIADVITGTLKESIIKETGEMSSFDINPGGDDYEWAQEIETAVKALSKQTKGKVKFIKMNPFDKYQGPYASVTINGRNDKIWSIENELYFIDSLRMTGEMSELGDALNGDKKAMKNVLDATKEYE